MKKHKLYKEYKFPTKKDDHPETRSRILREMKRLGHLECGDPKIGETVIADRYGDALDSIIAATAAFNAIRNDDTLIPEDGGYWKIEGYVYA